MTTHVTEKLYALRHGLVFSDQPALFLTRSYQGDLSRARGSLLESAVCEDWRCMAVVRRIKRIAPALCTTPVLHVGESSSVSAPELGRGSQANIYARLAAAYILSQVNMDVSISDPKVPWPSSFQSGSDKEKAIASSTPHGIPIDGAAEKRLVLKVDLAVLPILFLLFLVSFVDRSNLANARIEGLEKSLHIPPKSNGYNVALFCFTIPYVLLEVPANMLLKRIRPNWWLSGLMFSWGICTMGQGFSQNLGGLATCRALMGLFESGFVPGCAYLIGSYYKRHEFQFRYSIFFSAAILAGAFSGFLAYLLAKMDGVGGYEGWRWIFIIEGLITVVIALVAFFVIAPWPEDCRFLTPHEKEMLLERLAVDRGHVKHDTLTSKSFVTTLTDWKIWAGMLAYFGADHSASAVVAFQPTILTQLGYKSSEAQIHTIPVFMVALVLAITVAWFGDRTQHRYAFCMLGVAICLVGWTIQLAQANPVGVRYFGMFAITSGVYILMPVLVVWNLNNLGTGYRRVIGAAFQIGGGNSAALVSQNVFISKHAPKYPEGFGTGFALNVMAGVCCTALFFGLRAENKRRDRGLRDYRFSLPQAELDNLGDDHPNFRYTL
ncbi:hypothetical protein XPA_006357 [Xanthoria parietina]